MTKDLAAMPFGKRLELAAAMVVAASTGLTMKCLDPGGGSEQLPDFSMLDSQGAVVGVLEVTTTTVPGRARFAARVRKHSWKFPELEWVWTVHVVAEVEPRELHRKIVPLLRDLENAGRTGDWIPALPGLIDAELGALPRPLADLGVRRACAFHRCDGEPGAVLIGQAGPARAFSVGTVAKAVEYELHKKDNVAKLSGRGGRAELFVWLDVGVAQAALGTLVLPEFQQELSRLKLPSLPGRVTAVWAAAGPADYPRPVTALLRCDGWSWSVVDPPACTAGQPGGLKCVHSGSDLTIPGYW